MEVVKRTKEYTISKRGDGRYAVQNSKSAFINGEEKVKILLEAKLIKLTAPKKKEEPKAEEAKTDSAS